MEGTELDEAAYATKVEEAFIAERGTPFLVSPKDWTLIRGWRDGGIPVDVVVRAVHETFEKRRARGQAGKISSIAYCAGSVEELWEMERRGLVGKATGAPVAGANAPAREEIFALLSGRLRAASERLGSPEGVEEFLRRVSGAGAAGRADAVPRAADDPSTFEEFRKLGKLFLAAASKIEALPRDLPFEESEEKLAAIEASLVKSALRVLPSEQQSLVEARVAAALGDVAGLSPHVVDRMRRALTRREVRLLLGLPALTLLHG
ncbi:MAG TPA: hypothetical protein VMV60_10230 [Thermoanaerobaculia bacterium]|nr:hypothetical protein [Thermoanaerobaculia bacterium]